MTEEIRYIANLQKQEEFDNEVTELEDELKSLEQENKELKGKYSHILELAKTNADSNEYCLQELEQENKDFETLTKSLYKRIEELEKENEALAFREILYKSDYEASEQENRGLKDNNNHLQAIIDDGRAENKRFREENKKLLEARNHFMGVNLKYFNALEEIRNLCNKGAGVYTNAKVVGLINEVLNN